MKMMIWLILVTGYGLSAWAAKRRSIAGAALCFLDGGYLALLCFAALPRAMGTEFFYHAAGAAGIGAILGLVLEKKNWRLLPAGIFALVTGFQFLWAGALSLGMVLFLAFLGGLGLYHASSGILPERIEIRKALLSAVGFLFGTFLFAGF